MRRFGRALVWFGAGVIAGRVFAFVRDVVAATRAAQRRNDELARVTAGLAAGVAHVIGGRR